ncbi:tyrosine-type recombinase/integrase [Naumannella sp. ID2617S]|nr:tyrosine-type recombinase/integrase [Naumannella sp. ID2617S]
MQGWQLWLRAAGRPRTTIKLRLYQVGRFARVAPRGPARTSTDDLVAWIAGQQWSAETARSHRAALVAFFRWGQAAGWCATNPAALMPPIRATVHPPRPAPESVVSSGLTATEERVRLMVALAARAGLRRGEIARVRGADVTRDLVGWSLRVRGKGGRVRVVPLPADLAARITEHGPSWRFPGQDSGHLSPARVGELVSAALPAGWTCHTLRHRYASAAYAGSRDLLAVQQLLGHSKPETTRGYVALPGDALRAAAGWAA